MFIKVTYTSVFDTLPVTVLHSDFSSTVTVIVYLSRRHGPWQHSKVYLRVWDGSVVENSMHDNNKDKMSIPLRPYVFNVLNGFSTSLLLRLDPTLAPGIRFDDLNLKVDSRCLLEISPLPRLTGHEISLTSYGHTGDYGYCSDFDSYKPSIVSFFYSCL